MTIKNETETAQYLGVTVRWLRQHTRNGFGPITVRINGVVHYALPTVPESIDCKPVLNGTQQVKAQQTVSGEQSK